MKRNYIALYLPLIDEAGKRHTRNICVSFGEKEKILFGRVKKLHSHEIKKAIGIFSYRQLIAHSQKENRKPTELIKLLLTEKLIQNRKQIKIAPKSSFELKFVWKKKVTGTIIKNFDF